MLKATYFKNKYGDPLFLCFILICYHKMILYMKEIRKIKSQTQFNSYLLKINSLSNLNVSSPLFLFNSLFNNKT